MRKNMLTINNDIYRHKKIREKNWQKISILISCSYKYVRQLRFNLTIEDIDKLIMDI